MMCASNGLAGKLVQRAGKPLSHTTRVHKDQRRRPPAYDLEQAWMNALPDAGALRSLRCRPARQLVKLPELRHIFHRNFNRQLQRLPPARIADRDWTIARPGCFAHYRLGVVISAFLENPDLALDGEPLLFRFSTDADRSSEKATDFFQRTLGRAQPDALNRSTRERLKPFQR